MAGTSADTFEERRGDLEVPLLITEDDLEEDDALEFASPYSLTAFLVEAWRLLYLAIPLSLQYAFAYSTLVVCTAFVGHLGAFPLSVAVLSTSLYNVLGLSIGVGFASAVETLCGQAYGAKQWPKMGILLQRALIVCFVVYAFTCILWSQMTTLLRLAGQEPRLAEAAAHYLHLSMPALFFAAIISVVQRYLQSQGVVFPVTVAIAVVALLAPCYLWVFVVKLDLGLWGAPSATGAVNFSICLCLVVILIWRERQLRNTPKQMWHGWSTRALKGLHRYLEIALASTGMICIEWWSFEVVVLMAGLLSDPDIAVASLGVLMSINAFVYMIPRGMSGAASTRVSNELGAGHPTAAWRSAWTAVLLGTTLATLLAALVYMLRRRLLGLFTDDAEVLDVALRCSWIMCLTIITDGANVSIEGVIRGSGAQRMAAVINALTYWCVGIPTAYWFAFPLGYRVEGFWYSRLLVTCLQLFVMLIVLMLYNWEKMSSNAIARITAATPRHGDVKPPPRPFARISEEVTALAASQALAAAGQLPPRTSAVSIGRRLSISSDGGDFAHTPQYCVSPGGAMPIGPFASR